MPANIGTVNGPGYSDVADFLIELTRTWGGSHTFTITPDRDRRGLPNLYVVLKHRPWSDSSKSGASIRAWSSWPCGGNVTFSGLLFRLCFELNEKLERRKLDREKQTAF